MRRPSTCSAPTMAEIRQRSSVSLASVALIVPLVVAGVIVGRLWLGVWGGVLGALVGFTTAIVIEVQVIAGRLGITRSMMLVCRGLNPRGRVDEYSNTILVSYGTLRTATKGILSLQLNVDRLANDLFKGLNALSHHADIDGFRSWEAEYEQLVQGMHELLAFIDEEAWDDLDRSILSLRLKAKSYSRSIIENSIGGA